MNESFKYDERIKKCKYFYSDTQKIINLSKDNIGEMGQNLTIAVLSMNQSNLTLRLMESIEKFLPNFKGEFVVGDNCSKAEEKQIIFEAMNKVSFRCRMVEFNKNYGVVGGRNRLFSEVATDWILSLDNDMVFVSDILEKANDDIAKLGCHFLCLPFIDSDSDEKFNAGFNINIDNTDGQPILSMGKLIYDKKIKENEVFDSYLCTALHSRASIIKKKTFFQVGAFDEEVSVGFEDLDFSVQLFLQGYKVGCCGMVSLLHDYPKAMSDSDANYEKLRISHENIKKSALYLEDKYQMNVWNEDVSNWLTERQINTGIMGNNDAGNAVNNYQKKPKVALVVDKKNWAFDNIANQVVNNLYNQFEFAIINTKLVQHFDEVLVLTKDYDIIHFFWRGEILAYNSELIQNRIKQQGYTIESFHDEYIKNKIITTAVYDHLFLSGDESYKTKQIFAEDTIVDFYCVSSKKLMKTYNESKLVCIKPNCVLADGVDLGLFFPKNLKKYECMDNKTIVFGWVGNSKWNVKGVADLKGIGSIIKPTIQLLIDEGYDIALHTSDSQDRFIPHDEMPEYYASIDCYLCASLYEGTPNPILESMACGVPVITTDVGIVPEVFGEKQKGFILEERSVECMANAIRKILQRKDYFQELSEENLNSIKTWDWSLKTKGFAYFWNRLLEKKS